MVESGQFDRPKINELTGQVIGAAIEVHKALGPGLLESVYEDCMAVELKLRGLLFERQKGGCTQVQRPSSGGKSED